MNRLLSATKYLPFAENYLSFGSLGSQLVLAALSFDTTSAVAQSNARREDRAGTGYIGFNGGFNFRPINGMTFRAGYYEGLVLTSVALAPDQSASLDTISGTAEETTGAVYFGGACLSATLAFESFRPN